LTRSDTAVREDSGEESTKPSRTLALFLRSLWTVKGRSAPNGGLPTLKLSLKLCVELPETPRVAPLNVWLDVELPVMV